MQELQAELKAAKERWAKEVELSKAEKGAPGYPFPVSITRYTPRPDAAAAWDCEELPVRLVIHNADAAAQPVSVEIPPFFPGELSSVMEKAVEAEWKKLLSGKKGKGEMWMVEKALDWVESHFAELLRSVPAYVDCYVGCDDMGASMRRYTLMGPAAAEEEEEEEEGEVDEEEQERRIQDYFSREKARIEAEIEDRFRTDEERRRLAQAGLFEEGQKARQLSKKELAELNKSRKERSGHRWRKTPSKAHKPIRDEDDKGKKDKKK